MYGWAVGLTLWFLAGLTVALIHGAIVSARDTQIPTDTIDTIDGETVK